MVIEFNWTQFKDLLDNNEIPFMYEDTASAYSLYVQVNGLIVKCYLKKNGVDELDFEASYKASGNKNLQNAHSPFASKAVGGQKLYKRVRGVKSATILAGQSANISLVVPYAQCKISAIELVGGSTGDTCHFKVYDTPTGTISATLAATGYTAIPNLMLNQFGFDVNIADTFHREESAYDADLIQDMKLEVNYTNNTGGSVVIGINFVLHELK